ncbi:hypothetical protein ATK78_1376 [Pedobacter metabolipauper]|uniref:Uncharacterized protein n=2 Tax=Pedobacter metabolipauper TaxID=425513 RepID=A0A4R6SX13_9SPHI|nr:hypothetical protein ATK78_1376 [Pedobacter metabolipauper]
MNLNGVAQEQIPIKSVISSLPKGSEKASESNMKNMGLTDPRYSVIRSDSKVGELYKIGNTLVKINAVSGKVGETHLEDTKNSSDGTSIRSRPAFYKSEIKYINDYKIWIMQAEYDRTDIGSILTLAVNKTNNKVVSVAISYYK